MRSSLLGLYALAPVAIACSAPLATPGGGAPGADSWTRDAAEGASSAALVVVERTVTADDTAHASAVGRFIKMRSGSVDEQALRMVGATLDLPGLGTCAPSAAASATETDEADGPRAVELLDVGAVAVEANGLVTTLEARSLPDIVDLVTGVLYSTRSSAPDGLPSNGSYVIRSSGSTSAADGDHSVPPFSVSAAAPSEPLELRIDGQDARMSDGVVLTAAARVDLAWEVSDASDPDDLVYVELVSATGAATAGAEGATNVRCLFADHGAASIPASAFVQAGDPATEMSRGTLIVHRIHREAFQVLPAQGRTGIDSGVVRFDFARAAEFTRR